MTATEAMDIEISVYRRLDNRFEGLSDDSPRALELHHMRRQALHEALSGVEGWTIDFGNVDDSRSHELAVVLLHAAMSPHVQAAVVSGATWAVLETGKAFMSTLGSETAKLLLHKLIAKQREGKFLNFWLKLPLGLMIYVSREGEVNVELPDPPPLPDATVKDANPAVGVKAQ